MTQVTKLKRLERKSHYMLDKPSVTLKKGNLYFSSSAVDILEISKFSHCYISIPESSTPESAMFPWNCAECLLAAAFGPAAT